MNKEQLIESLRVRGFNEEIVRAFSRVPRENFIPSELKQEAYEDTALPIGKGQTISQPYTIAVMLSLLELKKSQKVLEVGSGCGYVLALLSEMVGNGGKVFGVEIIKELAENAEKNLSGYRNVRVYNKNGFYGLPEEAPFDRILISAAVAKIPEPLIEQLKEDGIIVAPVGPPYEQTITAYKKHNKKLSIIKAIPGFIFVPFVEGGKVSD